MGSDYIPDLPADSHHMDANWGRGVVAGIRRNRVRAGEGLVIRRTANGTVISAKAKGPKASAPAQAPDPFEPVEVSTGDPDEKAVTVTFGIVNNIIPTIDDTPLDDADPSTLPITGSGKIYLKTDWTGDEPKTLDSASVEFTEDDVPEDDEDHGYQLLSTITMSEDGKSMTINKGVTHSLRVERMHCSSGEGSEGSTFYGWAGV